MDSRGLLQFETLHEMNTNATIAYKDNPLFGTYTAGPVVEENVLEKKTEGGEGGKFVWMTYGEYGDLVNRCRTVLKDIGEWGLWMDTRRELRSYVGDVRCMAKLTGMDTSTM